MPSPYHHQVQPIPPPYHHQANYEPMPSHHQQAHHHQQANYEPMPSQQAEAPNHLSDLDEFKRDVRTWIELDDSIRVLQRGVKDRRDEKKMLTARIIDFMDKHDIEDLNTKNGRIRYKMTYVKSPLSHNHMKDRISAYFSSDSDVANELTTVVFGSRERAEKSCLRRMPQAGGGRQQTPDVSPSH